MAYTDDEHAAFYVGDTEYENEGPNFDDVDPPAQVVVGICAMAKKSCARPMQEILDRLERFEYITILKFDEKTILQEPPEKWPICDCLISFHSKGFPLDKAVRYSKLRQPMLVNDLSIQYKLQDRCNVYQILKEQCIDQPRYVVLNRESPDPMEYELVESDDNIEVNNVTFSKPFVEKPISAEDHNVYIYFPTSAGGGSQRLFRKIGSRSSVYSSVSSVRKTGSYIYEEFMATDGTDVKVYTVGPDYAHAEARKSPALDGKVERDKDGKEVRYPVILTAKEKMMARKICLAFKQNVCGFDLLRANGKSYVCDVNGFSFVKTSPKYYDDCAKILGHMILRQLAPQLHIPYSITYQPEDIPIVPTTYGTMMELRCVVAVIRHGDRTPKQKMKMEVRHKKFFDLFEKYGGFKSGHLKLKQPKQLQEVLDIARFLLSEIHTQADPEIEEKTSKLEQLKAVLEMYGHFSGINRKVQLKYQPTGAPRRSSDDDEYDPLPANSYSDDVPREPSLVLILKWGGELTPAGKIQAEELGKAFRCMYPGGAGKHSGDFGHAPGMGLLRLHSTFRHDLKIYASDEGRVQMTAAAFAKGFLALEGELPPILAQMVKSANMNGLLDNDNESPKYQNISIDNVLKFYTQKAQRNVKEKLQALLNINHELNEDEIDKLAPTSSHSLSRAVQEVGNPYSSCVRVNILMQRLIDRIKHLKNDPKADDLKLYHGESWELMMRRWMKLYKDFRLKSNNFDISKIPDVYDCIKYDLLHNNKILRFPEADELHHLSKAMADVVIPQEYGMTKEEKLLIGQCICSPLLKKIQVDLQRNVDEETTRLDSRYSEGVSTPHRHVRTRLYFTSESHIHSLLTIFRYGCFIDSACDEQWRRAMEYVNRVSELNYMTQIVIMMYEDPTKDQFSDDRFHVELHFSPGAYTCGETKKKDPNSLGYRSQMKEKEKEKKAQQKQEEKKAKEEAKAKLEADNKNIDSQTVLDQEADGARTGHLEFAPSDLEMEKHVVKLNVSKLLQQAEQSSMALKACTSLGFVMEDKQLEKLAEEGALKDTVDKAELSPKSKTVEDSSIKSVTFAPFASKSSSENFDVVESCAAPLVDEAGPSTAVPFNQTEPITIAQSCRKRHHSSNAVKTQEEKFREEQNGEKSSSLDEPTNLDATGKLVCDTRSVSMEDDLQMQYLSGASAGRGKDNTPSAVRTRSKRHSFLGFFANPTWVISDKLRCDMRIGGKSSLISTKVINGSSSAPDLTEVDSSACITGGVEGWKVPSVRPLETLHNSLTHKLLESFLTRVTESTTRTPLSSPSRGPSTPVCVTPRSSNPPPPLLALPGYVSSTCSSGGPSSPTSVSCPDDIVHKLKQLIARNEVMPRDANAAHSSLDRSDSSGSTSQVESPRNP